MLSKFTVKKKLEKHIDTWVGKLAIFSYMYTLRFENRAKYAIYCYRYDIIADKEILDSTMYTIRGRYILRIGYSRQYSRIVIERCLEGHELEKSEFCLIFKGE